MLSAKKLAITWGDAPEYWTYIPILESKFETVALLLHVRWFEIRGRTNTRFLSPKTRYSVYIVFKKADQGYGLKDMPIKAEVGVVGQEASRRYVCFDKEEDAEEEDAEEEDAEEEDAEEEDAEEEDAEEEDAEEEDAEEENAKEENAEEDNAEEEDAEEEDAEEEDAEEEDAEEEDAEEEDAEEEDAEEEDAEEEDAEEEDAEEEEERRKGGTY